MLGERIARFMTEPQGADPGELQRLFEAASRSGGEHSITVDLESIAIEQSLGAALPGRRLPVLALAPDRETSASDASPLVEHLLEKTGSSESARASGRRGVEVATARSWLAARQRDRKPALIVGRSKALSGLLETLLRRHLRFRLPAASTVFDLLTAAEPECAGDLFAEALAVAAERRFRVYRPPGAVTPFVARDREAAGGPVFTPAPWTRVRIVGEDGVEVAAGQGGRLVILDLARFGGGSLEVETGERGVAAGAGFRLIARGG